MYDVLIVGGGPAGYVAAIRSSQLGRRTALVEREQPLGGICLNWGCIPSKALLASADLITRLQLHGEAMGVGVREGGLQLDYARAQRRSREVADRLVRGIDALMAKNHVEVLRGSASLVAPDTVHIRPEERRVRADHVILCTGARPRPLPGLEPDGERVITSREALARTSAPQSVLIVGGGAIGVEFAHIWASFGSRVAMVELTEQLLPGEDPDIAEAMRRALGARGVEVQLRSAVQRLDRGERSVRAEVATPDGPWRFEAETVLVAAGLQANSDGIGLEELGVRRDRAGFVVTDQIGATNLPGLYAVGDVASPAPHLAHAAMYRGVVAVEHIAGLRPEPVRPEAVPRPIFGWPQVAAVGLSEPQARARGLAVRTGRFPLVASGKAQALAETEGFAKAVVDSATGALLGMHLIGPEVTELLPEAVLQVGREDGLQALVESVHAHPTLAESLHEAVLAALGQPMHI